MASRAHNLYKAQISHRFYQIDQGVLGCPQRKTFRDTTAEDAIRLKTAQLIHYTKMISMSITMDHKSFRDSTAEDAVRLKTAQLIHYTKMISMSITMDHKSFRDSTAEDAVRLKDGAAHQLCENDLHSRRYFDLLSIRRRLQASAKRQEFLDLYHQHQQLAAAAKRQEFLNLCQQHQ
ncbi:uncharacterized protein FFUJ_03098 [Fusarium fujikuroi IMI 58289]|uniref:Uncharacterized protein n=1 Tax=Gibberella fujikuroi (strain CBS 195.34 / IMI 58289 / NRRL A-6831) TaxID=1279085 RepID=S0DUG8_GIBF5|nr:uncharacterized protein FFUJ_03098 [Fusarium fujikuroi IMI 58289]QGI62284.1 hypothetical protein CEK27_006255 [Fusarium fujikuroi]QGI79453.1 hypothetical protein CEK25_006182 [Fusarium fujikuroi]QGI93180.1 hypothetical protein CEK26_006249 [Fusarium fujikuroi]CCT66101.1 uncharacterized protein FFUJ_03098 [Fusarium fujikuroi IMI 58289]